MRYETSDQGKEHIKKFEKFVAKAYLDPRGVWTIGWGTTNPEVAFEGNTITREEAEEWFQRDLKKTEKDVLQLTNNKYLNQPIFDALVGLVYNIGRGSSDPRNPPGYLRSTLRRKLNAGDLDGAALEFDRWVYSGGVRLKGLVRRRKAEREMFTRGMALMFKKPVETITERPTMDSNIEPDAPSNGNPARNPGMQVAAGVSSGGILTQATEKIEPLAPYSDYIMVVFVILSLAGIGYTFYRMRKG